MRIINFNCENVSIAKQKGFFEWLNKQDADIICLQHNHGSGGDKVEYQNALEGFVCYSNFGYSEVGIGVSIYTRSIPKVVLNGVGSAVVDKFGCFIQADFGKFSVVSIHVPSFFIYDDVEFKKDFFYQLSKNINKQIKKRREFVFAGTWGVDSVESRFSNVGESTSSSERWLGDLLKSKKLHDSYREVDVEPVFSFWEDSTENKEGAGRRIDYQLVTSGLCGRVLNGGIYKTHSFSRHAPVIIDYDWDVNS